MKRNIIRLPSKERCVNRLELPPRDAAALLLRPTGKGLKRKAVQALDRALREGIKPEYIDINSIIFEEAIDFGDAWSAFRLSEDIEVEKAFRTMKTSNLMMRPIRHWNPKRVEGHVFMCMLAYLIVWESRNRLINLLERDTETRECEGDSLREIWKALNKIKLGIIDCDGRKVTEISALTTHQKRILKALNAQIMTKERIRKGLRRHKKRN